MSTAYLPSPSWQTQPGHHQASSSSTSAATAAVKPPTDIHPTAHLDQNAYVQGSHAISLGAGVLVHPRARLVSTHGPLIIGDGVVVSEKCVIGGPAPDLRDANSPISQDPLKILVGENVMIHPAVEIMAGATVKNK